MFFPSSALPSFLPTDSSSPQLSLGCRPTSLEAGVHGDRCLTAYPAGTAPPTQDWAGLFLECPLHPPQQQGGPKCWVLVLDLRSGLFNLLF